MADTMQFDLVSPERSLASMQVSAVQIPGSDGDITAMPDHAPVIMTLRPGILRAEASGGEASEYVVTGGFAEITGAAVSVLAEKVVPVSEMTRAHLDEMIESARSAHADLHAAHGGQHSLVDDAVKLLADMEALNTHIDL
ncbi:MAG: F0F1 ATP synthase subunit epsilon [Rhodobacteraceae bacterium]|nr:F0F1 ATP synthase subunit epsilon [Paracoccaceae bacterium]